MAKSISLLCCVGISALLVGQGILLRQVIKFTFPTNGTTDWPHGTESKGESTTEMPLNLTTEMLNIDPDCGVLPDIGNGSVVMNTIKPGGIANYSCDIGFILRGNWQRTCLDNETWSGMTPSCSEPDCGALSNIGNGRVVMNTIKPGGIANYSCDSTFFLWGNRQRTCLDNETWSGMTPSCSVNVPNSYQVLGKTVTCSVAQVDTTSKNQQLLTCISVFVDGNIRIIDENGGSCSYPTWKQWSLVSSSYKHRVDLPSLCSIIGQQIWGVASFVDSEVYWLCDSTKTRASFVNNQWLSINDNGYVKSLRCLLAV